MKLTTDNTFMLPISKWPKQKTNLRFYKRFAPDIISKKKKDEPDLLFENSNNHHTNIKYTIETMRKKFLDTKIIYEDNQQKHPTPKMITLYCQFLWYPWIVSFSWNSVLFKEMKLLTRFIKQFHGLINNSYKIRIKWIIKKVKQLLNQKAGIHIQHV